MNNELLLAIGIANREFQEFIDQVSKDGAKPLERRGPIQRLAKVDVRLKQVAQFMGSPCWPSATGPEPVYEVMKYRENLKNLRNAMETLQFSLLAEKARIEQVRANMQAASAWATSLRDIS